MHYPPDIDEAWDQWRANCGPCALAAILGQTVMSVRPLFQDFARRPYVNVTHMKGALGMAGVRYRSLGAQRPPQGLCFIQWGGYEHRPIAEQYRHTHWIAVQGPSVFEVNAPELVSWETWIRVMPRLICEEKRGNGTFTIRTGLSVL
jgi:hypothetical protein